VVVLSMVVDVVLVVSVEEELKLVQGGAVDLATASLAVVPTGKLELTLGCAVVATSVGNQVVDILALVTARPVVPAGMSVVTTLVPLCP